MRRVQEVGRRRSALFWLIGLLVLAPVAFVGLTAPDASSAAPLAQSFQPTQATEPVGTRWLTKETGPDGVAWDGVWTVGRAISPLACPRFYRCFGAEWVSGAQRTSGSVMVHIQSGKVVAQLYGFTLGCSYEGSISGTRASGSTTCPGTTARGSWSATIEGLQPAATATRAATPTSAVVSYSAAACGVPNLSNQEVTDIVARGRATGRSSETIRRDLEDLNRARGGSGAATCPVVPPPGYVPPVSQAGTPRPTATAARLAQAATPRPATTAPVPPPAATAPGTTQNPPIVPTATPQIPPTDCPDTTTTSAALEIVREAAKDQLGGTVTEPGYLQAITRQPLGSQKAELISIWVALSTQHAPLLIQSEPGDMTPIPMEDAALAQVLIDRTRTLEAELGPATQQAIDDLTGGDPLAMILLSHSVAELQAQQESMQNDITLLTLLLEHYQRVAACLPATAPETPPA